MILMLSHLNGPKHRSKYSAMLHIEKIRVAPIPGICTGIGPIPAIFDDIRIGQVCYTSIINHEIVFSKSSS